MKSLLSITAATILTLASLIEAAPSITAKAEKSSKLPGLEKIKHVVYFMQVYTLTAIKKS